MDPGLESALGARVIKVGDVPIARAAELCKELFSRDENPTSSDSFVNNALTSGGTLHGLGITSNRNLVRYTLVDDSGREFTIDARSSASDAAPVRPFKEMPPYMQNPEQPFTCKLSLVKMLSSLNAFGISNIHGWEFKVRSCGSSDVTMLRLAKIRRKEFLRTTPLGPGSFIDS